MTADAPGQPHQPGSPGTASGGYRCVTSGCPACGGSGVVTRPIDQSAASRAGQGR